MSQYRLAIQPYNNSTLVKFNLQLGTNTIGSDQSHDICISHKSIKPDHCLLVIHDDEIELTALVGPVFMPGDQNDWILMPPKSSISLTGESQDFQFRIGEVIKAKIILDKSVSYSYTSKQINQVQSKQKQLIEQSGNLNIIRCESIILQSPLSDVDAKGTPNFLQENQQQSVQVDTNDKSKISLIPIPLKQKKKEPKANINQKTLDGFVIKQSETKIRQILTPNHRSKSKQHVLSTKNQLKFITASNRRIKKYVFTMAFSSIKPTKGEIHFLQNQNVAISMDGINFDYLIMENCINIRSMKLLIALSKGIKIISHQWLLDSMEAFELKPLDEYIAIYKQEQNRLQKRMIQFEQEQNNIYEKIYETETQVRRLG